MQPSRTIAFTLGLFAGAIGQAACDDAVTAPPVESAAVTYHRDVVPLLQAHCTSCHHPGGAGPMALDDLDLVRQSAELALAAMRAKVMPPWMPDRACRTYADERGMSEAEIDTFARWIELGKPAGDAADEPAAAVLAPWTPTDVVTISDQHVPDGSVSDDYHCFVLDETFAADTYITASQVVAGSHQVHHVLVYALGADRKADIEAADQAGPGPGYTCFGGPLPTAGDASVSGYFAGGPMPNLSLPVQIGAWVPGSQPLKLPADAAMRVPAGSIIIAQVHYNLNDGPPVPDSTRIELRTTTVAPTHLVDTRPLAVRSLTIPAGDAHAVNSAFFGYYGAEPRELLGVAGHMHLLGTRIQAEVIRKDQPDAAECALDIPRWDFHWQQSYRFRDDDRVVLRDGDGIRVTCTYDNSAANQPELGGEVGAPRDVSWGEGTNDEMCIVYYSALVPFTPPQVAPATPCEATSACVAACGAEPSADCLLSCPKADASCALCALRAGLRCSAGACIAPLAATQKCFASCLAANVMLGSNIGGCLAAECADAYADVVACVDPTLGEASCLPELAACGVTFPSGER